MAKIALTAIPGVIGVDEAGRGPLAGPVVVAAIRLPEDFDVAGLGDSKKLSRTQRETQAIRIRAVAHWHIELAGPDEIDRLNILWATMAAMERAVAELNLPYAPVLIDGNRIPNRLKGRAEAVIKGDGSVAAIAAASILAKTFRDQLMMDLAAEHPGYGFEEHFGYPTPLHLSRLQALGPCPIHRRSFAPVATLLAQSELPFAG